MAGHNIPIASQSSNRFAIMSSLRTLKFLIWTPMIIITIVALSISYHHASPSLAFLRVGCHPSSHEHKHTGHGEETVVTHFQHMREMEDFGEAGDQIWHSQLLPPKGGFLWVETNSTEDIVGAEGWGVTMFHALHCLQMIREVFKSTMSPEHAFDHAMPGHPPAHHDPKHATHCLAYLYQVSKQSINHIAQRTIIKENPGHHLWR